MGEWYRVSVSVVLSVVRFFVGADKLSPFDEQYMGSHPHLGRRARTHRETLTP
jgi:hypothetical protein